MKFLQTIALLFCLVSITNAPVFGAEENFTMQGTVTAVSGDPVQDAEVYLYTTQNTRHPADFISSKSGKNGSYRLTLPKTTYWGVARVKKGERSGPLMPGDKHSGEPVKVDPDTDSSVTVDFTVADMQELAQRREKNREELVQISGIVMINGKGVPDTYVYARVGTITAAVPDFFSGWTDAEGHYQIKLPQGKYLLGTARFFPPPESSINNLREIDITTGKLPVAINLQLLEE